MISGLWGAVRRAASPRHLGQQRPRGSTRHPHRVGLARLHPQSLRSSARRRPEEFDVPRFERHTVGVLGTRCADLRVVDRKEAPSASRCGELSRVSKSPNAPATGLKAPRRASPAPSARREMTRSNGGESGPQDRPARRVMPSPLRSTTFLPMPRRVLRHPVAWRPGTSRAARLRTPRAGSRSRNESDRGGKGNNPAWYRETGRSEPHSAGTDRSPGRLPRRDRVGTIAAEVRKDRQSATRAGMRHTASGAAERRQKRPPSNPSMNRRLRADKKASRATHFQFFRPNCRTQSGRIEELAWD